MNTFISYDGLPLASGGAHSISSLSPLEAYGCLVRFFDACTNHPYPETVLLLNLSKGSVKLFWQLTKMFGLPKCKMNGVPPRWEWRVKNTRIDAAFGSLQLSDALTLTLFWKFKLVHPDTKRQLEGQDAIPVLDERMHNSQIYFRASRKSTVSAWLTLPFSSFAEAINYFAPFSELLPFKPSVKHWRIWKCSKNGIWSPRRTEQNLSQ
jgi:hypothetical protein